MFNGEVKKAKIIAVDDSSANNEVILEFLQEDGFADITTTADPRAAIVLLSSGHYDLLLLDLMMPGIHGFELLDILRSRRIKTGSVIILTAKNDAQTRLKALSHPLVQDFIIKPFSEKELIVRVTNVLELYFARKTLEVRNAALNVEAEKRTADLRAQNKALLRQHELIRKSQIDLMHRLGLAGEKRDNETGAHVARVAEFCRELALSTGNSELVANSLFHTSPMHDVGKIGIPDCILLKPGRLDDGERKIMNTHTVIGAEILNKPTCNMVDMARKIALTHHEKWNGTGYPNGLAGDEIPLEGRVVALVDVFDALTSERPYKKAWSNEKAFELIQRERGTHFDPRLVDGFFRISDRVTNIQQLN